MIILASHCCLCFMCVFSGGGGMIESCKKFPRGSPGPVGFLYCTSASSNHIFLACVRSTYQISQVIFPREVAMNWSAQLKPTPSGNTVGKAPFSHTSANNRGAWKGFLSLTGKQTIVYYPELSKECMIFGIPQNDQIYTLYTYDQLSLAILWVDTLLHPFSFTFSNPNTR